MLTHHTTFLDVPGKPAVKIVAISGEIDQNNLELLKKELQPILDGPEYTTIILHLKDLEFINSVVIQFLASVHFELEAAGRKLVIAEASSHITDILKLVGLLNVLEHFPTLPEALRSLDI
jgi:anti-anti-sigma factor